MLAINIRHIARYFIEVIIIVILALMAFFLFIKLLDNVFPQGTTLRQIMSETDIFSSQTLLGKNKAFVAELRKQAGARMVNSIERGIVAKIQSIVKTVKSKKAGKLTWNRANVGHQLYDQDAIQTFKRSRTKILFDNNNYIDLRENSLIIIKKLQQDLVGQTRHARLILSSGRFFGKLAGKRNNPMTMEITTGNTVTKIQSTNSLTPARFNVKVNPDKSSTIAVVEGSAIISTEDQSVEVNKNQVVTVTSGKVLPEPVSLPDPVSIVAPKANQIFSYHEMPRPIKFEWKQRQNMDSYTIQIARDKYFKKLTANEMTLDNYFSHNNLKKGKYYWKVRGNIGWIEGHYSKTHVIYIEKDINPPTLKVNMPPDIMRSNQFTITGSTDTSMKIFINEIPVKVSAKGFFTQTISLQQGANLINVEAMDKAGNVSYQSKIVNVVGRKSHVKQN